MKHLIISLLAVLPLISCGSNSSEESSATESVKTVDLGLSVLWGDRNLGAGSVEDIGDYYAPGDIDASEWRLPSKEEMEELKNECTWEWTGNGYNVTGPSGNSIFLPLTGQRYQSQVYFIDKGYYWSSTPCGGERTYIIKFDSHNYIDVCWNLNGVQLPARPVKDK